MEWREFLSRNPARDQGSRRNTFFGRNRRASSDTDEQAAEGFGRQGCLFGKCVLQFEDKNIPPHIHEIFQKDCLRISDLWRNNQNGG